MFDPAITIFPKDADLTKVCRPVKFGIDPTGDRLHLGHLVPLLVLQQLRLIGHEIHIILGTQTAQLGDPSGRDKMRPILSQQEVEANAEKLLAQVHRVLGGHFVVHRNGDWLGADAHSPFSGACLEVHDGFPSVARRLSGTNGSKRADWRPRVAGAHYAGHRLADAQRAY
jgi:hypothetical protein